MDILFIHPNFPGQFLRLSEALCNLKGYRVTTIGAVDRPNSHPAIGNLLEYPPPAKSGEQTQPLLKQFDEQLNRGLAINKLLLEQKRQGFEPEVIYVHPGWGDGLFLKDLFPNAKLVGLFEWFYSAHGADVGFDPEFPRRFVDMYRLRIQNTVQLHALNACDILLSPTQWQRKRYPDIYQPQIQVLHEGIDTVRVAPKPQASLRLSNGCEFKAGDEVLTYVSRGLEPYRGFHSFIRALPAILNSRPDCHVLIVGGEKSHYGPEPNDAESWKVHYLKEVGSQLDMSRIHFLGKVPYEDYLSVLQVSRLHIYLTYPFVLSWSMLEAMSTGCLLLASDTPPVREFVKDGINGLLCPFFDQQALVEKAVAALSDPQRFNKLARKARADIRKHYDFKKAILPAHLELLEAIKPH